MRDWLPAVQAMPTKFGAWASFIEMTPTIARADCLQTTWTAKPDLWQPFRIVNGGVHCTVTETLGSFAAAISRLDHELPADAPIPELTTQALPSLVGLSNHTDFYRALRTESVVSTATPVHTGRLQQVWVVETRDEQDRLVARGQVRIQNL